MGMCRMKRQFLFVVIACLTWSGVSSGTLLREKWNQTLTIDSAEALMKHYPPDVTEVIDAATWQNIDANGGATEPGYCARVSGWITVPTTGNYQFHLTTDDTGRLYVSQDENMANAVKVAYLDKWAGVTQWNKFPLTQHSAVMSLKEGQVMAIYATMQQSAGGDSIAIGWTGPGLSQDIANPTLISNWVTHTSPNATRAKQPVPETGKTDISPDTILTWKPGEDAAYHDVYFGAASADVGQASRANSLGVLISKNQDANTYDPPERLELGTTYYWRVDEVAADGTITQGTVWQFEVEPQGYAIAGSLIIATASSSQAGSSLDKTIDGSGLDAQDGHSTAAKDMWHSGPADGTPAWVQYGFDKVYKLRELRVWNYNGDLEYMVGLGLKDVSVRYSTDGAMWNILGDVTFAQGPSSAGYMANTTVSLAGLAAKYVRLVINSGWGSSGRYGLSEVRFLYDPTWAREPSPASGATDLDTDIVLSWRAGRDAESHHVYLGADEQAVVSGTAPAAMVDENRYDASGLSLGTTYYWKVDEVNPAEEVTSWEGEVWNFTTQDSYVVDGFESYTDDKDAGLAIWQTWRDGYDTTDNGSQVGHDPGPYAEWNTVHEGLQSMPVYYNNESTARISEATRTFDPPQDWTRGGVTALRLYFYGDTANTTGRLYVKINDAKVLYDGDASDLTKPFWIPWTVDLTTVSTNLKSVKMLILGIDNGGSGTLFFDDLRLYRLTPPSAQEELWVEAEAADAMVSPMRRYSDRADASGGRYIATFGDSSSGNPPDDGVANYTVKLTGGTYRIIGRVIAPTGNDDSFWVRLQGATTNTANHTSGWIRWGLDLGDTWHNVPVRSMDDADQTVLFTVEAGIYNLEIAFREDGALLDAWMITKQLQ